MKKIGITGGIGSGKTTVAKYLESLKYKVIDADNIARELTKNNPNLLKELINCFGGSIINNDQSLNRKTLGKIVFKDPVKRKMLDDLFQPKIMEEILKKFDELEKKDDNSIIFLDAPLIFEVGLNNILDKVWLVDADQKIRIQRIRERDLLSNEEIVERINSQMGRQEKVNMADEVILNNGSVKELKAKINQLIKREL